VIGAQHNNSRLSFNTTLPVRVSARPEIRAPDPNVIPDLAKMFLMKLELAPTLTAPLAR
jgi:hypothetical protein